MLESVHRRLALFLTCILVTGAILLVMAAAFLLYSQKQLSEQAESAFNSDVNAILYHMRSQPVLDHTWLAQTEASGGLVLHVELNGQALLYHGTDDPAVRSALVESARKAALDEDFDLSIPPDSRLTFQEIRFLFTDGLGDRYRAAAAALPLSNGWVGVLVARPLAPETEQFLRQLQVFSLLTLGGLCLLALFAWSFTRRTLRPIEESRQKQMEFIAAASHELRSPLAVIHTSLSALKTAPPDRAEHFLALADGECMRLSRLVGDLLALAGADSGTWTVTPAPVELETLVLNICEGFEGRAREQGVSLIPILPDAPLPPCPCDGERMAQVLSILVDNGLSYTPAGGRVRVETGLGPDGFWLTVSDNGCGIPDSYKPKVFERFYRADPARTNREHYGLGLSVARELVALHHGTISVADSPDGGAAFTVTLPQTHM